MQLINIDRTTFEQLDPIRRIIDAPHSHRFAIVDLDELGKYGLGWNSTLIEPSITIVADSMLWIGVDENIVALELNCGRILVALPLYYPLFEILEVGSVIAIITELEVLVFNQNGSLRFTEGLPDIAASWRTEGNLLVIELLEHAILELNVETGKTVKRAIASC